MTSQQFLIRDIDPEALIERLPICLLPPPLALN